MAWRMMLAAALFFSLACDRHEDADHAAALEQGHEHATGPHGGSILELRDNDGDSLRVEFIHAPEQQRITLHLIDVQRAPALADAPTISLIADGRPEELTTIPLPDQPTAYTVTHPAFAGEEFKARATVRIGQDKFLSADLGDHHHHHDHDH